MAFGLGGIKIIETARAWAGPMASQLLADWGADVIKVENPIREAIRQKLEASPAGMAGLHTRTGHRGGAV